jgi:hypothetical protein
VRREGARTSATRDACVSAKRSKSTRKSASYVATRFCTAYSCACA